MKATHRAALLLLSPLLVLTLTQAGADAGAGPTEEDVREAFASVAGQDLVPCDDPLAAESCDATLLNVNLDNRVFCQRLDDRDGRCEFYWPFVNPTIHPELAPPSAFTYDPDLPDKLSLEIQRRDEHIGNLGDQITRLETQLARKKALIKKLRKQLQEAQQS